MDTVQNSRTIVRGTTNPLSQTPTSSLLTFTHQILCPGGNYS